jgi:hypothetical protein
MKQREHEALDRGAVLNKSSLPGSGAKLPKRANEATCVLAFFAIAARKRISEKNPAFSAHFDHNGPDHDV